MMVQNEHWNGQPRPASKVVTLPMVLRTELPGKNGVTDVFERRQIVDVIVERFERARGGIAHHFVHAAFGFAGEQRDAHVEGFLQIRHHVREHRQHAGDVEAADDHRDAGLAQRFGDVQRARILVRLHADQADEAEITVGAHLAR